MINFKIKEFLYTISLIKESRTMGKGHFCFHKQHFKWLKHTSSHCLFKEVHKAFVKWTWQCCKPKIQVRSIRIQDRLLLQKLNQPLAQCLRTSCWWQAGWDTLLPWGHSAVALHCPRCQSLYSWQILHWLWPGEPSQKDSGKELRKRYSHRIPELRGWKRPVRSPSPTIYPALPLKLLNH